MVINPNVKHAVDTRDAVRDSHALKARAHLVPENAVAEQCGAYTLDVF